MRLRASARSALADIAGGGDYGPDLVPKGMVFVMGDNCIGACDSRLYGPVPLSRIKGRVIIASIAPMTWLLG
jgi:type IV secretory pathway protease TraF